MLSTFWTEGLYRPLFNFLIWIYNDWTNLNMGWAIVYMTLALRTLLLPFTIVNERNRVRNIELTDEVVKLEKEFRNDQVLRKEQIRKVLKKRKVQPWAKAIVLGIQGLVLVLLYQVFLQGITGERLLQTLYGFIDFPGVINTMFYGFDLRDRHDIIWPGAVTFLLAAEIYIGYRKRKAGFTKSDLIYLILFPGAVFLVLWWLPLVKALFVLTSLIFSAIVSQFANIIFKKISKAKEKLQKEVAKQMGEEQKKA